MENCDKYVYNIYLDTQDTKMWCSRRIT